ncbi:ribonuclease H-like domain-containing protein [Tanacetum coccineum]
MKSGASSFDFKHFTHASQVSTTGVIVNGDAPIVASASAEDPIPPKTVEQKLARKNELKAKSIMLLAIPNEHMLKFHGIKDAKSLWEAIKNRVGGNKESKKIQKTILKQNYENFVVSSQEGLANVYDSLPSAWTNIALIIRNKFDLDTLSMNDLYNHLMVYKPKIKGQSSSSSNYQNVAFVSSYNTSSTNEAVNTANDLDNEDLEQIDTDDLEEMDLKSHVAILTMRMKRFIKKTRRNLNFNGKEIVGFDKTKVECYNCHKRGYLARECRAPRNQGNRNGDNTRRVVQVETPANALVIQDGIGGYDLTFQVEEDHTNFALMAYTSQGSSVHTCSKDCLKSYETFQNYYDQQREALNKSNLEIIGYQMGLESLEARIVVHEKNEAVYEENIAFLKYDVQVKVISIEELKNYQISAKDKTGLGYDSHVNESEVLDNVVNSMFDSQESDWDNNQVNDRFKKNDSVYKSKVSETITSKDSLDTTASETSKDSLEKPKTVRPNAPIIED